MASRVNRPCFRAFLSPQGEPDPAAPPCMRPFPLTAGDMQVLPERVLAAQRAAAVSLAANQSGGIATRQQDRQGLDLSRAHLKD